MNISVRSSLDTGIALLALTVLASTVSFTATGAPVADTLTGQNVVRPVDTDGDGLDNGVDNCITVANPAQRDTDGDGIGNFCDADLSQDCVVNFVDIAQFSAVFLSSDPDADINGDGSVNFLDFGTFAAAFLEAPGPSGLANICADTLTLTGVVTASPIPLATLTAEVNGGASSGGVVEFSTITEGDGSYTLGITAPSTDDFVTLSAAGSGALDFVRLKSLVGSVTTLAAAGDNDGSVDDSELSALKVTHLTTAFAVLAEEANDGPILSDQQLTDATLLIDASALVRLAGILKTVIDNPGVTLPTGIANTLALIEDVDTRNEFNAFLFVNYPAELTAAISATATELQIAYTPDEIVGELYLTTVVDTGLFTVSNIGLFSASYLAFSGSSVTFTNDAGTAAGTWSIETDGSLLVTLSAPLLTAEFFDTIEDPNNPGFSIQTPRQSFLEQITVHRIRAGASGDHAFVLESGFDTYPDFPELEDIPFSSTPEIPNARLAVDGSISVPFSGSELVAQSISALFLHRDNGAVGTIDPELGYDTLDFNADGTGATRRRGLAFSWQVLANGELELLFSNSDIARLRALVMPASDVRNAVSFGQLAGGTETVHRSVMVTRDESQDFDTAALLDKRFRSGLVFNNTTTPNTEPFDFVFSAFDVACRLPGSSSSTWSWGVVDGRMELIRDFSFDPAAFFYRTWQPIRVESNQFWVIETLQVSFDGTPPVIAAQTPGRLNIYTLEQDLSGNLRPTLNDDAFITGINTPVNFMLNDFLGNDSDPENDQVFLNGYDFSSAAGGTIEPVDAQGIYPLALKYTPPPGFIGTDTFTYTANDLACGAPSSDAALIEITVE